MYEGEVFTYRSGPAPRAAAAGRQPRQQRAEPRAERRPEPRTEPLPEAPESDERAVLLLERRIARLEERVAQLSALVQPLQPLPEEPKVTVQLQKVGFEQPVAPPSDVKVTLFGSGSTEAILGQVKVTQQY
jgi:hypothetical protein